MAKLPLVSGEKAAKAFSKAGWITARQTGSHLIMIKKIDSNSFPLNIKVR
jgi:predicted RNA binding protein YcfA (HicA-like mRNA interferase family)